MTSRCLVLSMLLITSCSARAPRSNTKHGDGAKTVQPGSDGAKTHAPDSGAMSTSGSMDAAPPVHGSQGQSDGASNPPHHGASDAAMSDASDAHDTNVSAWKHGVGAVLDDDSSVFCVARTSGKSSGHLESSFRRVPSDPDQDIDEPYAFSAGRLRARFTCSEGAHGAGRTLVVNTPDSQDAADDTVSADCPSDFPYGSAPECQIEGELHLIYQPESVDDDEVPHASGDTCIASITEAKPSGQITGFNPEWMDASGQIQKTLPLFNEDLMRTAQVGGTDEGAIFLAQGKLYFSFGDTSDIDANDPLTMAFEQPGTAWRSNVLGHTADFDARDGIQLDGFETGAGTQAKENVVSPHMTQENPGDEFTAIPLAGFGLTAADGHRYRFLWFVSVHKWFDVVIPDFQANYSSLAYSKDESADWTRIPSPPSPPDASFGPGAIWFDRYHRYLYFFGVTPDHGSVRLARVRSAYTKVIDPEAYSYWNGSAWVDHDPSKAVDLIPSTDQHSPRSETSVVYNPAAGVYMMMLVNWYPAPIVPVANQVELWQAPSVTGPWKQVDADAQLPNGSAVLTYGPMMSEHLLIDGGLEVPVLLSQMYPVYNVHLWSYRIRVAQGTAAADCPR